MLIVNTYISQFMDSLKPHICIFAWRCLRYKPQAAACNREGGGLFCGDWRRFNGNTIKKKEKKLKNITNSVK